MKTVKTTIGRRSFIKRSTLVGGGIMLSFNWLASCDMTPQQVKALPKSGLKSTDFLKSEKMDWLPLCPPIQKLGKT